MARDASTVAPSSGSCGEGRRRRAGCVGTWLKVAAMGLAFFAAGAAASDASGGRLPPPFTPGKYGAFRGFVDQVRVQVATLSAKLGGKDSQLYTEMNSCPPKPLQVFEYGPSRPTWARDPKKYKYQYVCVVATMGSVEEGIWHRRKAPSRWFRQPPFHVRIVRPNPAGMLDHMLAKKKIRLATRNVTIKRTDKTTGEVVEKTKPMTVVERTDVELPPHLQDMLEAEKEGREWKDPRPTKGRWGPSTLDEVKEEGVMEFLAEAGIETPEEVEDITKVIDTEAREKFDLRRYFDYGDTARGYRRLRKIASKFPRQE
ncbi:unnamed protein product [Scytosiphon promiscuus]